MVLFMCGISGFFELEQQRDRLEMQAIGKAMTDALQHRGPDNDGLWQDPDLSLLLGHRRLSIIDLSSAGHQPMESASGRYIISYNGEIYNFQELAIELESLGVVFKGRSDTEVMLAAFEKWGVNQALQKLNGMFALTLWDRETGQLHLVRDRLGKKPLYVGWADKTLVFGSELKALHAHPDFKPQINKQSLTLYMRYACVPAPHCIYENVWQLPAGCRMTIDLPYLKADRNLAELIEPYWHHPRIVEEAVRQQKNVKDSEAIATFEKLLTECVRQRMISDVPLGAFLSGGIDSSLIVALMQQLSEQKIKTFSIGFDETGFDEAAYAKKVAHHLGTDHHELYLKPQDALDIIPQLADIYDEPFADASQIPSLLVSQFARKHVTVALSGDGGDEMFGGYLRHYVVPEIWRRVGWLPVFMRKAMAGGITAVKAERWNKMVPQQPQFGERIYKVAELLPLRGPEDVYRHLVSQFHDPATLVESGNEPDIALLDPAWQPKGLSFAERMMYGDALSYLPNDILTKVDRASMNYALETRAPLLDPRIFEYAWSLPLKMKIREGKGKWLLRQVLQQYLPGNLFERPKQGFTVPVSDWLRGPLKDWAESLIDEKRLREEGFLNAGMVREIWNDHQQGKGRHAHKLWTVLMFQSWLDKWSE